MVQPPEAFFAESSIHSGFSEYSSIRMNMSDAW